MPNSEGACVSMRCGPTESSRACRPSNRTVTPPKLAGSGKPSAANDSPPVKFSPLTTTSEPAATGSNRGPNSSRSPKALSTAALTTPCSDTAGPAAGCTVKAILTRAVTRPLERTYSSASRRPRHFRRGPPVPPKRLRHSQSCVRVCARDIIVHGSRSAEPPCDEE